MKGRIMTTIRIEHGSHPTELMFVLDFPVQEDGIKVLTFPVDNESTIRMRSKSFRSLSIAIDKLGGANSLTIKESGFLIYGRDAQLLRSRRQEIAEAIARNYGFQLPDVKVIDGVYHKTDWDKPATAFLSVEG